MGSNSSKPVEQPDPETKRKQMLEAMEKRQVKQESRGIKDVEGWKKKQKIREKMEKSPNCFVGEKDGLKWVVGK